jgi:hypothetical protein
MNSIHTPRITLSAYNTIAWVTAGRATLENRRKIFELVEAVACDRSNCDAWNTIWNEQFTLYLPSFQQLSLIQCTILNMNLRIGPMPKLVQCV